MSLGILAGTSLLGSQLFAGATQQLHQTRYGEVDACHLGEVVFVQRHGVAPHRPPHKISHHANIALFADLGIERVVALNSTGSLREDWTPGTLVVPNDYFNLFNPPTFFDQEMRFTVPKLDGNVRQALAAAAEATDSPVVSQGVYVQVQGPILETPAEVRFLATLGDLVGMTMAHEAILAAELGLQYASLCLVDNFANGIANVALDLAAIDQARANNLVAATAILNYLIKGAL